jgi:hypothetical protein
MTVVYRCQVAEKGREIHREQSQSGVDPLSGSKALNMGFKSEQLALNKSTISISTVHGIFTSAVIWNRAASGCSIHSGRVKVLPGEISMVA